jgi:hypothetical protein
MLPYRNHFRNLDTKNTHTAGWEDKTFGIGFYSNNNMYTRYVIDWRDHPAYNFISKNKQQ